MRTKTATLLLILAGSLALTVAACDDGTSRQPPDADGDTAGEIADPDGDTSTHDLDATPDLRDTETDDELAEPDETSPDVADVPDTTRPEFALEIWVDGNLTPKTLNDGFAGQTPDPYYMGMARFELMSGPNDPAPVTILDFGSEAMQVDMRAENLVGVVDITTIPPGVYTYARVLLVSSHFDVEATLHTQLGAIPTTVSVVTAVSDWTLDGTPRAKGWSEFSVDFGTVYRRELSLPELPSTAGGTLVDDDGMTWMVFPMLEMLSILDDPLSDHEAHIIYDVADSFRWEDLPTAGYATNVFDVDPMANTWEPVRNYGATDYRVVIE